MRIIAMRLVSLLLVVSSGGCHLLFPYEEPGSAATDGANVGEADAAVSRDRA